MIFVIYCKFILVKTFNIYIYLILYFIFVIWQNRVAKFGKIDWQNTTISKTSTTKPPKKEKIVDLFIIDKIIIIKLNILF